MKKHLCFILLLFVGELSWAQISNDKPKGQVVMITTKAYDEIYNFGEVSELKLGTKKRYRISTSEAILSMKDKLITKDV